MAYIPPWLVLAPSYTKALEVVKARKMRGVQWRLLRSRSGLDLTRWRGDILIVPGWATGWDAGRKADMENALRTAEALGCKLHNHEEVSP